MEWQYLEYFQTVARLQHFTRAAAELSLSQPALSRAIARLEEELGVPLFERRGRRVLLNRYGRLFLARVERALEEIAAAKKEIADLTDPGGGQISLAFLHTLGAEVVPRLLGSFRSRNPQVTFQLHQDNTEAILDMLDAGEIDFGLCSPVSTRSGLSWLELFTEELYAVVPREHALARRSGIDLRDLAGELFVTLKKGYGLRLITDQLCQQAGFTPRIVFEGEEVPTVGGLVAAGQGVALIPAVPGLDRSRVVCLPVIRPPCRRAIAMVWREGRYLSPSARRFCRFVTDRYHGDARPDAGLSSAADGETVP